MIKLMFVIVIFQNNSITNLKIVNHTIYSWPQIFSEVRDFFIVLIRKNGILNEFKQLNFAQQQ